jgi:uncharacterized membrane protein
VARDPISGSEARAERYASDASVASGFPGDLVACAGYAVAAWVAVVSVGIAPSLARFLLGVPLLVFLPGYALVAALFPGRPSRNASQLGALSGLSRQFDSARSIQRRGVRWGERVALAFGLSLFLLPPLALAVDLSPWAFDPAPIVSSLVGFVFVLLAVATVRRLRLPREQRFALPVGAWVGDFRAGLVGSPVDALVNLVLIFSIVAAVASMTYALAVPNPGSTTSGIYLLAGNNETGELAFADYPTDPRTGGSGEVTVLVENDEQRRVNYTVVAQLERVNGNGTVVGRTELDSFTPSVAANESWRRGHNFSLPPGVAGDDLRLAYLLYRGEPPADRVPLPSNAYREAYLSLNVTAAGEGG